MAERPTVSQFWLDEPACHFFVRANEKNWLNLPQAEEIQARLSAGKRTLFCPDYSGDYIAAWRLRDGCVSDVPLEGNLRPTWGTYASVKLNSSWHPGPGSASTWLKMAAWCLVGANWRHRRPCGTTWRANGLPITSTLRCGDECRQSLSPFRPAGTDTPPPPHLPPPRLTPCPKSLSPLATQTDCT